MSKNIRIRTEPNGGDKHVKIQLNQDFDFLEILSLKISQEDVYRTFYSDYGVVVGRVLMNSGVGVPNAKVSIFIPLTSDDANDEEISNIYPYSDISIVNSDGIRYNVLPKDSQNECHTPVGTFPSKKDLLDNDKLMSVYDKYYKYTTTTNDSGDFMIFGVPIGNHILNVDVDLSDIGIYSQRPYDFIEQGNPPNLFDSPTKFKKNTNLNNLTQLKNRQIGVNVIPFWGEEISDEVGITRVDVDLNYELTPKAIFMGSIFGDNEKNSVNKNCRPRKKLGKVCEMGEGGGTIQILRKTLYGENERFDVEGGKVIDNHGAWAYQIPMNLDYMVTDEYGNLVPTEDTTKGIPTRSRMRFKISMDETGGNGRLRSRANYLVPNNPNNPTEIDYSFDDSTPDIHFRDFYWNKIYTVKNHIARFQKTSGIENRNFIGFKDVDNCVGTKNPIPFNTMDSDFNPIYSLLCLIITMIITIVSAINSIIGVKFLGIKPFCWIGCIKIKCNGIDYKPGCKRCGGSGNSSASDLKNCIELNLAEALNVFEFDFYNEWLNGSLYAFLLKYKKIKSGDKFCGDSDTTDSSYIINTNPINGTIKSGQSFKVDKGPVVSYNGELFYKPMSTHSNLIYATDIFNLGSVFGCDWQGKPKIHDELVPTSYQLPEYVSDGTETTITDLLFDINCTGVDVNNQKSTNIRRLCELGVGLDEDVNGAIDNLDITNELLRRNLMILNDDTISNISFSGISSSFTSQSYIKYRFINNINSVDQSFGNSYYFYFGTSPNKTAVELMNSKYFTTCTKIFKNPITIIGNIIDIPIVNGNTGSISITINGGSPTVPNTINGYKIEWSTGEINTLSISDLTEGSYYVTVTDGNGTISKKTFIVKALRPLQINTRVKNAQTQTSTTGAIYIDSIVGGIGPYDVTIVGPLDTYTWNDVPYGISLENIGVGDYIITVNDSNTPISEITPITLTVTTPQTLTISNLKYNGPTCLNYIDGVISFTIQGGTPDYTIELTTNITNLSGGTDVITYNSTNNSNLNSGTYYLKITDSYGQIYEHTPIVLPEPIGELTLTNIGGQFTLSNTISGLYYNLILNNVIINTVLSTGTITDIGYSVAIGAYYGANNYGCESNTIDVV